MRLEIQVFQDINTKQTVTLTFSKIMFAFSLLFSTKPSSLVWSIKTWQLISVFWTAVFFKAKAGVYLNGASVRETLQSSLHHCIASSSGAWLTEGFLSLFSQLPWFIVWDVQHCSSSTPMPYRCTVSISDAMYIVSRYCYRREIDLWHHVNEVISTLLRHFNQCATVAEPIDPLNHTAQSDNLFSTYLKSLY